MCASIMSRLSAREGSYLFIMKELAARVPGVLRRNTATGGFGPVADAGWGSCVDYDTASPSLDHGMGHRALGIGILQEVEAN
jgi:hypothetical protein